MFFQLKIQITDILKEAIILQMKNLEEEDLNKKSQQLMNKIRFLKDYQNTFQREKLQNKQVVMKMI